MKGNKMLSTIIAFMMVMSAIAIVSNVTNFKLVGNASATTATLSDVGSRSIGGTTLGLYPGQQIEFKVEDNSLNASEKYYVKVWNGTHWKTLNVVSPSNERSDAYGDLNFIVNVPGWYELVKNPLLGVNGTYDGKWNISLFDTDNTQKTVNYTITITNAYHAVFKDSNGTVLNNLIHNTSYVPLSVEVYNWTGSDFDQLTSDDDPVSVYLYYPDATEIYNDTNLQSGLFTVNLPNTYTAYKDSGNLETVYWVNISNDNDAHSYSYLPLPVKLDVSFTGFPSSPTWDATSTISFSGRILDGQDNYYAGYPVKLYSPTANGGHTAVVSTVTDPYGYFNINNVPTGSGETGNAGTWYVGTQKTGGTYRIDETDELDITNFISYGSFELSSRTDAKVKVRNSDDIISGFDQTINVSIYNSSWMDNYEYQNMQIHVTGLTGYYGGNEYDNDDVVLMSTSNWTDSSENYCYYTFTWRFNDTGTATIVATYPGNDQLIQKTTNVPAGVDNDEKDLLPNIRATKTFTVVSPDNINMIIQGTMVDRVQVDETGDLWQNGSQNFVINIYGDTQDEVMNATLEITGCGLDILINESDAIGDNEYLVAKPASGGNYTVNIAPKTAGTLTIKATNGTGNYTATKDYIILGLTGSVTTSDGDDLEIEVGSTETITVTVTNGQYAEVHLTLFDENWAVVGSSPINMTEPAGDGTAGNGLNGIFEFTPDVDDLDDSIGYIVVAAKAGGYYMYDIIEITPVYDLTITMTTPTEGNQTFTAGIEQDIAVQITNPDGDIVDDIDTVTGELLNEDGDTIQTIEFTEDGNYWTVEDQIIWFSGTLKITAKNQTGDAQHEGSASFDVEPATVTFTPGEITCAIGLVNQTITVTVVDALGNPITDTRLYLHRDDASVATWYNNKDYVDLDDDGAGEFKLTALGDIEGKINATLQDNLPAIGNRTSGQLTISFPVFTIDPETIFIRQSNIIKIWAYRVDGETPIEGINLTLFGTGFGDISVQPDPVQTDSTGKVIFSINPDSSGILNVTIARNVRWVSGDLQWTNAVITESHITIDSLSTLNIALSKSPIKQGETLTVTVTTGTSPVSGVTVTFGENTEVTNSNGVASFTVPDPGVESAIYTVTAEKNGYVTKEKSLTVIKVYELSATATVGDNGMVTVNAILIGKGAAVGATIEFNGETETTDINGKATFTAPAVSEDTDYTATVTYDSYTATATVTISPTPGFELLTLIAAIGVAFILLRRRRNK